MREEQDSMALYINRSTFMESTERDGDEEDLNVSFKQPIGTNGRCPEHLEHAIEESEQIIVGTQESSFLAATVENFSMPTEQNYLSDSD